MTDTAQSRDAIRSALFGQKSRTKIVRLDNGAEIEVRQPKVKALTDISSENLTALQMNVRMLCTYCFVPGTNISIFEAADLEGIGEMPAGGYYGQLVKAIEELIDLDKAVANATKNSLKTPSENES